MTVRVKLLFGHQVWKLSAGRERGCPAHRDRQHCARAPWLPGAAFCSLGACSGVEKRYLVLLKAKGTELSEP